MQGDFETYAIIVTTASSNVVMLKHKVKLSGRLRYRPTHLWKTVDEIVVLAERVNFHRTKCECCGC